MIVITSPFCIYTEYTHKTFYTDLMCAIICLHYVSEYVIHVIHVTLLATNLTLRNHNHCAWLFSEHRTHRPCLEHAASLSRSLWEWQQVAESCCYSLWDVYPCTLGQMQIKFDRIHHLRILQ
jgi:hypothetical protein